MKFVEGPDDSRGIRWYLSFDGIENISLAFCHDGSSWEGGLLGPNAGKERVANYLTRPLLRVGTRVDWL